MSTFKSFLAEATNGGASVNVTKFTLPALLVCYENAGYELSAQERKTFLKAKYDGFRKDSHVFWILCENPDEQNFYVTQLFVTLNEEGLLAAEPSGRPDWEGDRKAMEEMFVNV